MTKISVLIPTRNRPDKLERLLESLTYSTITPHEVLVVSSGQSILSVVSKFKNSLLIRHIHTSLIGQVPQKRLGIDNLSADTEWCLFLDDDLILERTAIQEALVSIERFRDHQVIGIGLSLPVTSRASNVSSLFKLAGSFFHLYSKVPGKVLRSGYASSYSEQQDYYFSEWLNGASMWKVNVLSLYGQNLPSTNHASCEDLIFSFSARNYGKLLFSPKAKAFFQDGGFTNPNSVDIMVSAAYWRYYFVSINHELSKLAFFKSQLGRLLFSIFKVDSEYLKRIGKGITTLSRLLIAESRQKDPLEILRKYIS
jgi:glycosyltransferase involved in cell wall biosynthesis